ncbi:hypothetical protein I4641_08445 [Waterburya agarophytonicola K14]|uniref:S-layer domain-containing protein n=1 Tax=Waterburya agarophytonicola KI4 TaxID=2874699 RepID=A0A964BSE9_9CYAN|nr:hypothetical protein [Waterburya agarophytonicola]MCC0177005.1 hypothetical protein [Waterburya agarophytonicola KI4]
MFNAKYSKVTTSISITLTALTAAIAPFANITPAQAQLFPSQPNRERIYNPPQQPRRTIDLLPNTVPRGFVIPVEYDEEKILLTPEETIPLSLYVAADVKDSRRNILIPYGSEIIGEIRPNEDQSGSFFLAEELVFPNGTTRSIDAISDVVTRRETIKKGANAGEIIKGAAIGAAAATVLSEIFGDIEFLEVLGGAGAGAIAGLLLGGNEAELVSIDPNNDLHLTLQTNLALR